MSTARPTPRKPATLSMALQRDIRELREEFLPVVDAATTLTLKRKTIAPDFMKLYYRYKKETGGTFVAFVHELDPKMPVTRSAYQDHSSYQSALYLKRLAEAPETTPKYRKTASPFRVLASVMDTLLHYTKSTRWRCGPRSGASVAGTIARSRSSRS